MLYTIPNFQNPTGITLPEARRRELLSLARRYNFLIVEDDVYCASPEEIDSAVRTLAQVIRSTRSRE